MTVDLEPGRARRRPSITVIGAVIGVLTTILAIVRLRRAESARIKMSITIDRPVHEVFAFVSDARNVLDWLPAAVERRKITGGPIGVGTRFEATDRMAGRLVDHIQEIIGFESDRSVTTRISAPWNGDYEIRVEPSDGGTVLHVDTTARPTGWFRFFSLIPTSVMQRSFEQDYARLKELLEGQREPATIPIDPEAEPIIPDAEEPVRTSSF